MKLCKDCEYIYLDLYCHAPQNGISPVDGKPIPKFANINRLSKSTQLTTSTIKDFGCGPDGTYWKQKIEETKPWWRFWK